LAFFPVSYVNLLGMLRNLDPSLDEAALSLGAKSHVRFIKVTLPMMMPGIIGSFLLFFVEALADLANPLVIGGNFDVLSKAVYQSIVSRADFDGAAGYAIALLVPGLLLFAVQRYWVGRRSAVSVTGKPAGQRQMVRSGPARYLLGGAAYAIGLLIVAIYVTILVGGFVRYVGVDNTFTLANFQYVLFGLGLEAVRTTTLLAAIATPIASVCGLIIAWLAIRRLKHTGGALDLLGMFGIAVPGTVIGIGYAIAFSHSYEIGGRVILPVLATGGAVLGGQLALIMVFVVRSIPAALRAGSGSISQIDVAIEEAATTLGATTAQTWRKVTLPIVRPALVSGAIYAFARSMTTLSPVIFITSGHLLVISVAINNEVSAAKYGVAFAYCSVLIAIVLAGIGLISLLLPSGDRGRGRLTPGRFPFISTQGNKK
jgi:iron(III) transport system permease protein